jgi:poly(3-hydroxybutyrate) depolymerase
MTRTKHITLFSILILFFLVGHAQPTKKIKAWLAQPVQSRTAFHQSFFNLTLNKKQAKEVAALLLDDAHKQLRLALENQWKNKALIHDDDTLRFDYKIFGERPADGRSLYISMHGGGNAPARVNDQQWKNQVGLYKPAEGVYLAPRAPTNTWNLWHEPHIDTLFEQLIRAAVLFEGVNPNKVYIMGYSAGGDGVYQLAPRMADRWAAAAMMAGHPQRNFTLGFKKHWLHAAHGGIG